MNDKWLHAIIGAALLLSILGIIGLTAMGKPVPESLNNVASAAVGALAMSARPGGAGSLKGDGDDASASNADK